MMCPSPKPFIAGLLLIALSGVSLAAPPGGRDLLEKSKRILFLGDSITAAGQYVAYVDAWLVSEFHEKAPRVFDGGLPSETVSGLSEEGHAGGKFPRPDLAERLDRILKAVQPDLVIACYGINCGIYQPFDEARFEKYQAGMKRLKGAVEAAEATFVVMTPPFYDDKRSPKAFSYNAVLDRYSEWLLSQRESGWNVIDLHHPMTRFVQVQRTAIPDFTLQPDGVHPNDAGHWFVARQVIAWAGDNEASAVNSPQEMIAVQKAPAELLGLVQQRMQIIRDAYVAAAGHKRPGVAQGLPLDQAEARAAELTARIQAAAAAAR